MFLVELMQSMCRRPAMYVRGGGLDGVATFLDGYDAAVHEFGPETARATSLTEFGRWLSYHLVETGALAAPDGEEIAANLAWSEKLRRLYPAEGAALEALPGLYQRFVEDPARVTWPAWPSRL